MKWEEAKSEKGKGGKKRGCLLVIVALVVIGAVGGLLSRCGGGESEQLEWPSTGLATMLPKPESSEGKVYTNSDDTFWADVDGYSSSEYEAYVTACQDLGFTVEGENNSLGYEAYSEDGHHLSLTYSDHSEQMGIRLEAPIEMGALTWPSSGPGALVPAPASTTGKVNSDSSTRFSVSVGETSAEDYAAYVDACMAVGFDVDYSRNDASFSADNADGAHVSVRYEGFNTMSITVEAPEEAEPAPEVTEPEDSGSSSDASSSADSGAVSSDFKATMDAYEDFINEYIDFMVTYSESDDTVAMLADYTDMMTRYGEWAEQLDAIDEDSLSAADYAYYIEVTGRVSQRLLEVSL